MRTIQSSKVAKIDILKNNGEFFTALDKKRKYIKSQDYYQYRKKSIRISGLDEYTFKNEDEILNLVGTLITQAKPWSTDHVGGVYIYPVTYVYDPKVMIRCGLWPTSFNPMYSWFIEWLEGIDIPTLEFWNMESEFTSDLKTLHEQLRWEYKTLDYWRSY